MWSYVEFRIFLIFRKFRTFRIFRKFWIVRKFKYSENCELSDNSEYSLYSDNGGSHNKTLWCGNYVKLWAVTIPHNSTPTIQNPLIFPSILSYPPIFSPISTLSPSSSLFLRYSPYFDIFLNYRLIIMFSWLKPNGVWVANCT